MYFNQESQETSTKNWYFSKSLSSGVNLISEQQLHSRPTILGSYWSAGGGAGWTQKDPGDGFPGRKKGIKLLINLPMQNS